MDALRHLSWPNLILINRRQTSQPLQSAPISPISIPHSVQDLVIQIESRQECLHRRSSEGPRPHSPTRRSVIPYPASNHSRTVSPILEPKEADKMAPSKVAKLEWERNSDPYIRPTFPEGLGDNALGFFGPLLQTSRLPSAVYPTVNENDDSDDLPPIPDTPTGYARFGFISTESFNTAVRDLVQESPDTPIGGDGAAPMKRSFNVGTLAINGSRNYLDTPQIDVSSPPHMLEAEAEKKTALRSRSNFSDPFQESCESNMPPYTSASCPTIITSPQSPRLDRSHKQISLSLDGPGGGGTDVKDFAQQPEFPPLPDCCVSPRSVVSDDYVFASLPTDTRVTKQNLPGFLVSVDDPIQTMTEELRTNKRTAPEAAVMSAVPATHSIGAPPAPGIPLIIEEARATELNTPSHIPAITEEVKNQRPDAPNIQVPAVGIPTDATGLLAPPGPPAKKRKMGKAVRKGQEALRKGRMVLLSEPVLTLLVGRQLSKPTSQALKLISKGVPFDLPNLSDSAAPVPAPRIPA